MKILVIHGPNLNLLGECRPEVYGKVSIQAIDKALRKLAKAHQTTLEIFQSNHEGDIVTRIRVADEKFDAIVMNTASFTHTSVAIRDAVSAVGIPVIEVHLSNIYAREAFGHQSLIAPVARGQISGLGPKSYELGFLAALSAAGKKNK